MSARYELAAGMWRWLRRNVEVVLIGLATPVHRAYGGFMCVKVPAGNHTITFRYYPFDVYIGIALTLSAFLFALISGYRKRTR